jgi:hypothetical protein
VALGELLASAPPPTELQLLAEALGVDEDAFRD